MADTVVDIDAALRSCPIVIASTKFWTLGNRKAIPTSSSLSTTPRLSSREVRLGNLENKWARRMQSHYHKKCGLIPNQRRSYPKCPGWPTWDPATIDLDLRDLGVCGCLPSNAEMLDLLIAPWTLRTKPLGGPANNVISERTSAQSPPVSSVQLQGERNTSAQLCHQLTEASRRVMD
jgi:hypothetical protein